MAVTASNVREMTRKKTLRNKDLTKSEYVRFLIRKNGGAIDHKERRRGRSDRQRKMK